MSEELERYEVIIDEVISELYKMKSKETTDYFICLILNRITIKKSKPTILYEEAFDVWVEQYPELHEWIVFIGRSRYIERYGHSSYSLFNKLEEVNYCIVWVDLTNDYVESNQIEIRLNKLYELKDFIKANNRFPEHKEINWR